MNHDRKLERKEEKEGETQLSTMVDHNYKGYNNKETKIENWFLMYLKPFNYSSN